MTSVAALIYTITGALLAAPPAAVPLDLAQGWTHYTEGPWRIRYDHRDLLAMRHPWEPSETGGRASVSRDVVVPEDWTGEVYLRFYCSDDYHTDTWRPDGSWLTAEGFIGHRMKQILIDDRVVWSVDVSDPVVRGKLPYHEVKIPVKAGQEFLLTLLAFDAVGSETVLEGDFYQSANDAKKREEDPDAARFQTHIYWGDMALFGGKNAPPPTERPSAKRVREVHVKRWPLPPFGESWEGPVRLELSAPAGIPEPGFPVQCGVPLHAGQVEAPAQVGLKADKGRSVFAQKTTSATWPDGSPQWLLLEFNAQPGLKGLEMQFKGDKAKPSARIKRKDAEGSFTIDTGALTLAADPARGFCDIGCSGKAVVSALSLALRSSGETVPGTNENCTVFEEGPFRTTFLIEGRFDNLERTFATYRLYGSAYAGLPYLKLWLRLFNSTQEDLPVSSLEVRFSLPGAPEKLRVPAGPVEEALRLVQVSEKERTLNGDAVDARQPAFVAWDGAMVTVRDFRELFPKALAVEGQDVVLDLIAAEDKAVTFTPGEAKSHEVWLALGDVDPASFAAAVDEPPILGNAAYFCATGAFGPAAPHAGVPVLHEHMAGDFGAKQWEDFGQHFGLRDFPDSPYYGGLPAWSNNYYERMLGLWSEWFMSGDRAWYDLAFDVCRHLMDVAIVHSEVPGKDWLGAIHGPGDNHVGGPWNPTLRMAGLAFYHRLTGEPESREAFLGVADFCVRTRAGIDGDVRNQAGPFDAICTAYDETGEVSFIDDGAARVESVLRAMDMRRGVWPDEHGSRVYRGNVPWMAAQAARPLYLWYRATGDLQAAQALVGLAESIVCENTDWDRPGVVSGYSHNPHFAVSASYDLMILPLIFAAYELTEDTFFLDAAKAQWQRWLSEKAFDSPLNCYWNTPWLVWYLKHYDLVEADGEKESSE